MSQGSYNVPTGGSFSMVTFAGLMNSAYNALASQNAGASAPANGPGSAAQEFQTWFNTTNINFPVFNFFDGVSWDKVGTLDVVGSNWLPKMGGGMATIASAATTNIGASPQTFITISGTTTITSLGSAATIGEERKLTFSSVLRLTYNAGAIVTAGLADIVTNPGDTCTAIYQGSSIWVIWGYVRALGTPGFTLPTGAAFWMPTKNLNIAGAVRSNGTTIGSAASGAVELASSTALALFIYLYVNLPNTICPVSGGRTGSDQAHAITDFGSNKTIGLPDLRGMTLAGLDGMGSGLAGRLTSLTMSPDGDTAMATGGAQTVTLLTTNLPSHAHAVFIRDPGHVHTNVLVDGGIPGATSATDRAGVNGSTASATTGIHTNSVNGGGSGTDDSTATTGSSTAVNKMQPTVLGTFYLCL